MCMSRKSKSQSRVAILRRELDTQQQCVTQKQLAERCHLSTIYLQKLEGGSKPVTRKVALALSCATGAGVDWLLGKVPRFPIRTDFGGEWTREFYIQIKSKRRSEKETKREAMMCERFFNIYTDKMARILFSAFKKKKTTIALALIQESLNELSRRFQPHAWPRRKEFQGTEFQGGFDTQYLSNKYTTAHAASGIVQRLQKNLEAELAKIPFTTD